MNSELKKRTFTSIILIFFGLPKTCHAEIIHIAIISENKLDIFGAVIKSPFLPKGCLQL